MLKKFLINRSPSERMHLVLYMIDSCEKRVKGLTAVSALSYLQAHCTNDPNMCLEQVVWLLAFIRPALLSGLSVLLQPSAFWSGKAQSAPFSRETVKRLLKWFMESDFLDEFESLISFGCVSCVIIGKYTSKLHKWVTAIVVYHLCVHVSMKINGA